MKLLRLLLALTSGNNHNYESQPYRSRRVDTVTHVRAIRSLNMVPSFCGSAARNVIDKLASRANVLSDWQDPNRNVPLWAAIEIFIPPIYVVFGRVR